MSNVNRAVTRTRRAAHGQQRPAPAMRKTLALAQLHRQMYPPFTVVRRQPVTFAGMRRPMTPRQRVQNYRMQADPGVMREVVPLTGPQLRRAAKKARRSLAEWDLIQALGEDYARQIGWEW